MQGGVKYPFNFANRNGIPMIESTGVSVSDTAVTITIRNNAFRYLNNTGLILFKLNAVIPESAAALPIQFYSGNFTQPLTLIGGTAATGAQMNGQGVYLIYYAKSNNNSAGVMQLMTMSNSGAASTSNTNN